MTLIGIVIATHNRRELLKNLLISVSKQKLSDSIQTKVSVVDDGSTDDTGSMLINEFEHVEIINGSGNWWWTKCMNEGFKAALADEVDYILILNDDNLIQENYLSTLLSDKLQLEESSIIGSLSVSLEHEGVIDSGGVKNFNKWNFKIDNYFKFGERLNQGIKGVKQSCILSGRGTLIPEVVFRKIGLYDEKLIQYGSDDDFILRARKAGFPVYISFNAIVYNHSSLTSIGRGFNNETLYDLTKSIFNKQSSNSICKHAYMYFKHGYKIFTPLYALITTAATYRNYFKRKI